MNIFLLIIQRELLQNWRAPQTIIQPILFFILYTIIFPISMGVDNASLLQNTPAALWIALLLAILFSAEQVFYHDYNNGILAQDVLHLPNLWIAVCARITAAWLRFVLPLLLVLPFIAFMLHIPIEYLPKITLLMLLGSLFLLTIGTIGSALTLAQTHNAFLLFLIAMPLYIPALILGVTATSDVLLGLSVTGQTALLAALTLFALITVIPFITLAIRVQALP